MNDWPTFLLSDLTAHRPICYGVLKPGKRQSSGVPLIRVTDIRNNYLDRSDIYLITKELSQEFKRSILKGNEVLLSIQGTVGRVAICPPDMVGANISRTIAVIDPDERLDRHFLRYWLLSEVNNFKVGGATRASFNIGDIRKLKVPLPTMNEQKRIVTILNDAFSGIEMTIANTEKNLINARVLFNSYFKFVLREKGKGWPIRRLIEVCENLDSKRIPITKSKRERGDIPYYGASGVVDHVANFIFNEDLLLVSEDGANLLARTYPIAFSISGKTWVNNHAHVLRFENIESQKFIEYYLNSISLSPYVSGMAQPKLNQTALNSIPVPFPPMEIQAEVVAKLDDLSGSKGRLIDICQLKIAALTELKQSLLQKTFSGELTADKIENEAQEAVA